MVASWSGSYLTGTCCSAKPTLTCDNFTWTQVFICNYILLALFCSAVVISAICSRKATLHSFYQLSAEQDCRFDLCDTCLLNQGYPVCRIESMNSVMDDNRLLTLPSNERIRLLPHMKMIFEIRDLKYATPATATRAGILYISEGEQWNNMVQSWIQKVVRYWLAWTACCNAILLPSWSPCQTFACLATS